MANRAEHGSFSEGDGPLEIHRREVTSRLMDIRQTVDRRVAQQVGFEGDIFRTFEQTLIVDKGGPFLRPKMMPEPLRDAIFGYFEVDKYEEGGDEDDLVRGKEYSHRVPLANGDGLSYLVAVTDTIDHEKMSWVKVGSKNISIATKDTELFFVLDNGQVDWFSTKAKKQDRSGRFHSEIVHCDFSDKRNPLMITQDVYEARADVAYGPMDEFGDVEWETRGDQHAVDIDTAANTVSLLYEKGVFIFPAGVNVYKKLQEAKEGLLRNF